MSDVSVSIVRFFVFDFFFQLETLLDQWFKQPMKESPETEQLSVRRNSVSAPVVAQDSVHPVYDVVNLGIYGNRKFYDQYCTWKGAKKPTKYSDPYADDAISLLPAKSVNDLSLFSSRAVSEGDAISTSSRATYYERFAARSSFSKFKRRASQPKKGGLTELKSMTEESASQWLCAAFLRMKSSRVAHARGDLDFSEFSVSNFESLHRIRRVLASSRLSDPIFCTLFPRLPDFRSSLVIGSVFFAISILGSQLEPNDG